MNVFKSDKLATSKHLPSVDEWTRSIKAISRKLRGRSPRKEQLERQLDILQRKLLNASSS